MKSVTLTPCLSAATLMSASSEAVARSWKRRLRGASGIEIAIYHFSAQLYYRRTPELEYPLPLKWMCMRFAVLALGLTIVPAAQGDEWPSPAIHEVFSHNRAYFVRVVPGKSFGDTVGFSGAGKAPFATAEFYRLEKDKSYRLAATASLLNPVAPIDFFVTDHGFLL